jgi:hypothetical protein
MMKKYTWEEFFAKHGEKDAKAYEFRECYRENQIVFHPKFGKGFVSEIVSESKVEITFADARRILVHNRKDIPGSPLAAEDDGLPSSAVPGKTGAGAKGKDKKLSVTAKPAPPSRETPTEGPRGAGLKPAPKKPAEIAAAKKPAAKKPAAKKPAAKKPAPKKPAAKKPAPKKPAAKKPAPKKPAAKKPAPKKPAPKKPAPKKPTPKKPAPKKPAKKPAPKKPAAKKRR